MKKNSGSGKNKEIVNFEKSLQDWKLPTFSASDVFKKKSSLCLFPDCTVKTVEKEIPLTQRCSTFPLFSNCRKKAHQIFHEFLRVGMITVGVKPTKLGSNASAVICVRDNRLNKYHTVLAMVESSLCDGPIFFSYFPTYCVALSDSCSSFGIDVKIQGQGDDERVTLMYKFHYKVNNWPILIKWVDHDGIIDVEPGKTTLYLDNIAQGSSNGLVSETINWYQIAIREGLMMAENDVPTDGEVGDTKIDWNETAEAHVLKVDVPGFKREDVKVEVEDGGILNIGGERSNDQENGKWHREERSGTGKILRRLKLPENANFDELKAEMNNGVLTVTVPKQKVKKQEVKAFDISG